MKKLRGIANHFSTRLLVLAAVLMAMLAALVLRLWYVQVFQHGSLEERTSRQSVRRIRTLPIRGRIYAADGALLVDNRVSYELVFHVSEMRQPGHRDRTVEHIVEQGERLARLLNREIPFDRAHIERRLRVYPALPTTVFSRLDEADLAMLAELPEQIRGMEIVPGFRRHYVHPGVATHVLGFCGRVQPPSEPGSDDFSYTPLELRGRQGLERFYDHVLAGSGGMKVVQVDTLGYVHREIGEGYPSREGMDLQLTIDLEAQKTAENLLAGKTGAIVVVDVRRGGVVAMASSPTYDLSQLTQSLYSEMAVDDARRPLINRALASGYLPGSIIKPLIALSALETGNLHPDDVHYCDGAYRLTPRARPIRCWNRSGHGELTLVDAIEQSCNPFFNHCGVATGLDRIRPFLLAAGMGVRPGIDLPPVGGSGLVPSREWARSRLGRNWIAIDTAYLSMGQGSITLSPLQAAMLTAAIANGGTVYQPYLVQKEIGSDGVVRRSTPPTPQSRLQASAENLELLREGMYRAVNRSRGTARQARNPAVSLAGKTGTAQVQRPTEEYNDTWFIGYGPVDNPQWAIAVLIERGDSGGSTAAPLAGAFFSRWKSALAENNN